MSRAPGHGVRPPPVASLTDSAWVMALVVVAGLVAALGSLWLDWRLAVTIALSLGVAAVVVPFAPAPTLQLADPPRWVLMAVPTAWVATTLLPDLRLLTGTRSLAAASSGAASPEILLQLMAAAAVLLGLLVVLAAGVRIEVVPTVVAFMAYPVLAAVSVFWSRLPVYTAGRAIEFLALGALVILMTWVVRSGHDHGQRFVQRVTALYVALVVPLSVWMFLSPRHWDGRPTWPGGHPNQVAQVVAVAVILLMFRPRQHVYGRLPVPAWVLAGGLAVVQYLVASRTATAAMVAALGALWFARSMRDTRFLAAAAGLALTGVAYLTYLDWQPIRDFIFRDQSESRVFGFNGRRDLWNELLRDPLGNEVWGLGMGGGRDLLPRDWAGNAHNAWMDLLLSLGVVGMGLVTGLLLVLIWIALRWGRGAPLALVTFVVVSGTGTTAFHEPGIGLGALVLAVPLLYVPIDGDNRAHDLADERSHSARAGTNRATPANDGRRPPVSVP